MSSAHRSPEVSSSPSVPGFAALPTGELDRAAELFKALSHPDRLRLACFLGDGRVTTQRDLIDRFGWPQSTAARHVAALRTAGLLKAERHGPEVHLRLGEELGGPLVTTVCDWIHDRSG